MLPLVKNAQSFHTEPSTSEAVFSPDGRILAVKSDEYASAPSPSRYLVRLLDATTGTEFAVLEHPDGMNTIAFSPDGRSIATSSRDGMARLWDPATGRESFVLRHEGAVTDAAFSPDGHSVATASRDGTIRVSDAATGDKRAVLRHPLRSTPSRFPPTVTRSPPDRTTAPPGSGIWSRARSSWCSGIKDRSLLSYFAEWVQHCHRIEGRHRAGLGCDNGRAARRVETPASSQNRRIFPGWTRPGYCIGGRHGPALEHRRR